LIYIYRPHTKPSARETILAARSIIYSKLIGKMEIDDNRAQLPHLRNELACIRIASQLSLEDCRILFPRIRRSGTLEVRQIIADYMHDEIVFEK
jgi:hypothetical protein